MGGPQARLRISRALLALTLAAALACGDDGDGTTRAADPGERGPHPVGVRTIELDDAARPNDGPSRGPRHLVTEVWYPAAAEARGAPLDPVLGFLPPDFVALIRELLGDQIDNPDALSGAVRDAAVGMEGGPYPLIVLSHGNTSVRYQNFTLAEHLASHGFVVAAPDHIGNALFTTRADGSLVIINPLLIPVSFVDRLFDVSFLIDRFLEPSPGGPEAFLAGAVALGRGVGVGGHSFGATTTLSIAPLDERVAAIMPMAPAAIPVLTPPPRPATLFLTGLEDRTLGAQSVEGSRALFERSTAPRVLAEFVDGGHFTFTDGCAYIASVFAGDGCGSGTRVADGSPFEFVPDTLALPLLNRMATTFFRWALRGEDEMLTLLGENPEPALLDYRVADLPDGA